MACRNFPPDPPPPPPPPPPPEPPPGPPPEPPPEGGGGEGGGFFLAISHYGVVGEQPDSNWIYDFNKHRQYSVSNIRAWMRWQYDPAHVTSQSKIVLPNGSIDPAKLNRLFRIFSSLSSRKMKMDVTFAADLEWWDGSKANHLRGVQNLCSSLGPVANLIYPLDVANEFDDSYLRSDIGALVTLVNTAKALLPSVKVTASCAGNDESIASLYIQAIRAGAQIDVLCPHFPRDEGWGDKTYERTVNLRELMRDAGIVKPIYLQEEERKGYQGSAPAPAWSPEQALASALGARRAGAVGWCFHTEAGFNVETQKMWDQLDSDEIAALASISAALAASG